MLLSDKIKSEFYPDKANVIKDQLITHWISEEANEPPAGLCENCCLPSGSSLGHQARFPHPSLPLQHAEEMESTLSAAVRPCPSPGQDAGKGEVLEV